MIGPETQAQVLVSQALTIVRDNIAKSERKEAVVRHLLFALYELAELEGQDD